MDSFYNKIKKQLKLMTENEKDAWILSQVKILPDWNIRKKDNYVGGINVKIDFTCLSRVWGKQSFINM